VWLNAVLSGAPADEAVAALGPQRFVDVPGEDAPVSLPLAAARLRAAGVERVRLVLPVPGDASGCPGPPSVTREALTGGALLLLVGARAALVAAAPDSAVWSWREVEPRPVVGGDLGGAERELAGAIREATEALAALDIGSGRDGIERRLNRSTVKGRPSLPQGLPPRATGLLERCDRLLDVLSMAQEPPPGAVGRHEQDRRAQALLEVGRAVRRAVEAAASAAPVGR